MNSFIFDTHVWYWIIIGSDKVPRKIRNKINSAIPAGNIKVSIISAWEIAMLESKGRIKMHINCLDWIKKALAAPSIALCNLTPDIIYESIHLPGSMHNDPADKMIIASARILNATLVTIDKNIVDYSKCGYIKTLTW